MALIECKCKSIHFCYINSSVHVWRFTLGLFATFLLIWSVFHLLSWIFKSKWHLFSFAIQCYLATWAESITFTVFSINVKYIWSLMHILSIDFIHARCLFNLMQTIQSESVRDRSSICCHISQPFFPAGNYIGLGQVPMFCHLKNWP